MIRKNAGRIRMNAGDVVASQLARVQDFLATVFGPDVKVLLIARDPADDAHDYTVGDLTLADAAALIQRRIAGLADGSTIDREVFTVAPPDEVSEGEDN